MHELVSTQTPKESGVVEWGNTVLNRNADRIIKALETLGFLETYRTKEGKQKRVTRKYEALKASQPDVLPFPLNQSGSLDFFGGSGVPEGISLKWLSSSDEYHEIAIMHGTARHGPSYHRDIREANSSRRLKTRLSYNDGLIETTDKNYISSRLPLGTGNRDWEKEMDLLGIIVGSLEAAAKEAQRRQLVWSKLVGKLTGR